MARTAGRVGSAAAFFALFGVLFLLVLAGPSLAQEDLPSEADLANGRAVYEANCASCHRADGTGVPGTFPPVADNPNVADATYLESVIVEGLSGAIVVQGETYDSIMPGFAALDEQSVADLVAFVQMELNTPPAPPDDTDGGEEDTDEGEGDADDEVDSGMDRLIADGRLVYEANCSACHQADGSGRSGSFPPLLDNPDIDDDEYLRRVITQGLQGEIEALGETYNSVMPGFSLLDDEQVTALIVYLQEGLGEPLPEPPPSSDPGGTAGTSLPSGAVLTYFIGFLIALVGIGVVVAPIVLAKGDGGTFTPVQSWLKSGAIVLYFILATVFVPSRVVESEALASPPSVWDDSISSDLWEIIRSLIGTGVWLVALGIGVWGVRRVQRNKVI
jgi:mono/diheme cytochrome c family protein